MDPTVAEDTFDVRKSLFASAIEQRSKNAFLKFVHRPSVRRLFPEEAVASLISEDNIKLQVTSLKKLDILLSSMVYYLKHDAKEKAQRPPLDHASKELLRATTQHWTGLGDDIDDLALAVQQQNQDAGTSSLQRSFTLPVIRRRGESAESTQQPADAVYVKQNSPASKPLSKVTTHNPSNWAFHTSFNTTGTQPGSPSRSTKIPGNRNRCASSSEEARKAHSDVEDKDTHWNVLTSASDISFTREQSPESSVGPNASSSKPAQEVDADSGVAPATDAANGTRPPSLQRNPASPNQEIGAMYAAMCRRRLAMRENLRWFRILIFIRTFAILLLRDMAALYGYLTWCQWYWSWAELHGTQSLIHAAFSSRQWWRNLAKNGREMAFNQHRSSVLTHKASVKILLSVVVGSLGSVARAIDRMNVTLVNLRDPEDVDDEEEVVDEVLQQQLNAATKGGAAANKIPTIMSEGALFESIIGSRTAYARSPSADLHAGSTLHPQASPSFERVGPSFYRSAMLVPENPQSDTGEMTFEMKGRDGRPHDAACELGSEEFAHGDGAEVAAAVAESVNAVNPLSEVSGIAMLTIRSIANTIERTSIAFDVHSSKDEFKCLCSLSSPLIRKAPQYAPNTSMQGKRAINRAGNPNGRLHRYASQPNVANESPGNAEMDCRCFPDAGAHGFNHSQCDSEMSHKMSNHTNLCEVPLLDGLRELQETVLNARKWIRGYGTFARRTQAPPHGRHWWRCTVAVITVVPSIVWLYMQTPKQIMNHFTSLQHFVKRFMLDYVDYPLKAMYESLFAPRAGVEERKRALEVEIESFSKIIKDYHSDYYMDMTEAQLEELRVETFKSLEAGIADGKGLGLINTHYETAIRHPIRSAFFGNLLRLMLIQLTYQQLEVSRVVNGMDEVLIGNDLNFKFMALVPTVCLTGMTAFFFWHRYSSKMRPVHRRMCAYWRAIHRVITFAEEDEHGMTVGSVRLQDLELDDELRTIATHGMGDAWASMNPSTAAGNRTKVAMAASMRGQNLNMEASHHLAKAAASVAQLHNYDQGLVLLLVHHMRALALEYMSRYTFFDELLEDLSDLESVQATRHQRLLTLQRMQHTHWFFQPIAHKQ